MTRLNYSVTRLNYSVMAVLAALTGANMASFAQLPRSCSPVSGELILGRDLAAAAPALSALPPDLELGYSPTPGSRRVFLLSELQKLAHRYGIDTPVAAPVCLAWPLHPLSKAQITAALKETLAGRRVDLEVTDQCRAPVPDGDLVFPAQGLSGDSIHSALWSGFVRYAAGRRFSTWAQVRITLHEDQIVAARSIRAGEPINASDLELTAYNGPLRRGAFIQRQQDAVGKCARGPIVAGTVLSEAMLAQPNDVERQQLVTVHIRFGAAHVETQGIAIDPGYRGDVIKVKNPKTGRVFRAQVNDRGVVTVVPGGDVGLVVEGKKS